jgi:accessory colonization factor AcfC
MKTFSMTALTFAALVFGQLALAGPLDPDCTAEKAAKSAAAKATVGVGGRCSPAEAAKDSAKDAAGIDHKGPIEKQRDDDNAAVEATKNVTKKISQ